MIKPISIMQKLLRITWEIPYSPIVFPYFFRSCSHMFPIIFPSTSLRPVKFPHFPTIFSHRNIHPFFRGLPELLGNFKQIGLGRKGWWFSRGLNQKTKFGKAKYPWRIRMYAILLVCHSPSTKTPVMLSHQSTTGSVMGYGMIGELYGKTSRPSLSYVPEATKQTSRIWQDMGWY